MQDGIHLSNKTVYYCHLSTTVVSRLFSYYHNLIGQMVHFDSI